MKLVEQTPAYCSSCFNQDPQSIHIDLDAAWDGPVVEGAIKVTIDDLVLCANCVREAYGMLPEPGFEAEAEFRRRIVELEAALETKNARIDTLTAAVAAKDQDKRPELYTQEQSAAASAKPKPRQRRRAS